MGETQRMKRFLSILLITFTGFACEPIGPLAGSKLSGQESEMPSSWNDLSAVEIVQLETHDHYAVNLWGVGLDSIYYVASSRGPDSGWAKRIRIDNNVRLRINDSIYQLKATVITDADELDIVAAEFGKKYDLDTTSDFPDAVVYRLDPR